MPKILNNVEYLSAKEAAQKVGVHRLTLLRWIREGHIPDAPRDRNGWRVFSREAVAQIQSFAHSFGRKRDVIQPTLFGHAQHEPAVGMILAANAPKGIVESK